MRLLLISLDRPLPHLNMHEEKPLDTAETQAVAALLEQCIKTCEVLVAFALLVGGRPSRQ